MYMRTLEMDSERDTLAQWHRIARLRNIAARTRCSRTIIAYCLQNLEMYYFGHPRLNISEET